MRRMPILLIGSLALLGCAKEHPNSNENVTQTVEKRITIVKGEAPPTRDTIARTLVKCISVPEFEKALFNQLSTMRDGDSEILFSEMLAPQMLRSSSNGIVRQTFAETLGLSVHQMRSSKSEFDTYIEQVLKNDPLLQVLLVDVDGKESLEKDVLSDPKLLIVPLPKDFSDDFEMSLEAYRRDGSSVTISSLNPPDVPLLIVGTNERLDAIPNGAILPENTRPFYQDSQHVYLLRAPSSNNDRPKPVPVEERPVDEEGYIGGGGSGSSYSQPRYRKTSPSLSEYLPAARFKSQADLRKFEPRVLGRPEMRCIVARDNSTMVDFHASDKGWWNGNKKELDIRLFPWAEYAKPQDFYTVKWIEEDGGYSISLPLSFQFKGVSGSVTINIDNNDDHVGTSTIYYSDPVPAGGTRYDLSSFEFWINLK